MHTSVHDAETKSDEDTCECGLRMSLHILDGNDSINGSKT